MKSIKECNTVLKKNFRPPSYSEVLQFLAGWVWSGPTRLVYWLSGPACCCPLPGLQPIYPGGPPAAGLPPADRPTLARHRSTAAARLPPLQDADAGCREETPRRLRTAAVRKKHRDISQGASYRFCCWKTPTHHYIEVSS